MCINAESSSTLDGCTSKTHNNNKPICATTISPLVVNLVRMYATKATPTKIHQRGVVLCKRVMCCY
jgi:hypothetical protein